MTPSGGVELSIRPNTGPDRMEIRRTTPVRTAAIGWRRSGEPSAPNGSTEKIAHGYCADFYWSQARSQVFRKNPGSRGDAEPDRGSEGVLRPIPADLRAPGRTARRGAADRFQVRVPDLGLLLDLDARIRQVRVRAAEVRRRRMPPARHDLCGA